MIVDFTYYTEVFEGTAIPLETVKECICELAEQYQIIEKTEKQSLGEGEKVIVSESVGTWSASYDTPTKVDVNASDYITEKNKKLYSIVKEYLAFTGLLYRGVI